jgi:hypothetical protein
MKMNNAGGIANNVNTVNPIKYTACRSIKVQSIGGIPLKLYRIEVYDNTNTMIQNNYTSPGFLTSTASLNTINTVNNITKTIQDQSYYISIYQTLPSFVQLNFPSNVNVSKIILYTLPYETNPMCMVGVTLFLLSNTGDVIYQSNPINYGAPFYIYTAPFNSANANDVRATVNYTTLSIDGYDLPINVSNASNVLLTTFTTNPQTCLFECLNNSNCSGIAFERSNNTATFGTCTLKKKLMSDYSLGSVMYDLSSLRNSSFNPRASLPPPVLITSSITPVASMSCDKFCQTNNGGTGDLNSCYTYVKSGTCLKNSIGNCSDLCTTGTCPNYSTRKCTCLGFSTGMWDPKNLGTFQW